MNILPTGQPNSTVEIPASPQNTTLPAYPQALWENCLIQSPDSFQSDDFRMPPSPAFTHEMNTEIPRSQTYRIVCIAVIVLLLPVWIAPAVAISPLLLVGYASYLLYNHYFENDQHDDFNFLVAHGTDPSNYDELCT